MWRAGVTKQLLRHVVYGCGRVWGSANDVMVVWFWLKYCVFVVC